MGKYHIHTHTGREREREGEGARLAEPASKMKDSRPRTKISAVCGRNLALNHFVAANGRRYETPTRNCYDFRSRTWVRQPSASDDADSEDGEDESEGGGRCRCGGRCEGGGGEKKMLVTTALLAPNFLTP